MEITTYFRAHAYHNAWSNHRLLSACAQLPQSELDLARTSFFPSIVQTFNHILTVDWFYISALKGASIGYAAFEPEVPFPKFADFQPEQRASDRRLIEVCEAYDENSLSRDVRIIRGANVQTDRTDRVLMHLLLHQTHHRGQVHAMLSGTNIKPPQLDEFFCTGDQALRKSDFEALGFIEDDIWR